MEKWRADVIPLMSVFRSNLKDTLEPQEPDGVMCDLGRTLGHLTSSEVAYTCLDLGLLVLALI